MKISVELKPEQDEIEINVDQEALADLIRQLGFMKKTGDHAHFFSSQWGGEPLSDTPEDPSNKIIHHMKINLR